MPITYHWLEDRWLIDTHSVNANRMRDHKVVFAEPRRVRYHRIRLQKREQAIQLQRERREAATYSSRRFNSTSVDESSRILFQQSNPNTIVPLGIIEGICALKLKPGYLTLRVWMVSLLDVEHFTGVRLSKANITTLKIKSTFYLITCK